MKRKKILVLFLTIFGVFFIFLFPLKLWPSGKAKKRPPWIDNPFLGNVIGVIGWAENKYDNQIQIEIAKMRAYSELISQYNMLIKNFCKREKIKKKLECENYFYNKGFFTLEEIEIKEIWKDPSTGILYLWVIIKPNFIKKWIEKK